MFSAAQALRSNVVTGLSAPSPTAVPAPAAPAPHLGALARPSGTFAMVAMDQRDSLRTLIRQAAPDPAAEVGDTVLVNFKLAVAQTLGPLASGFLIDRHYGFAAVRDGGWVRGGLVLAADALEQAPGQPVLDTELDRVVTDETALDGVAALKLLLIWRHDERRAARVALARDFIAAARRRGVLSVLEPVVRATPTELTAGRWDADAAAREAAAELSRLGPDLYKAQVPRAGVGTAAELERAATKLAASIGGPWVVLSQGVAPERFLAAVTAACRGGASGFLAGRALWSDVVGAADVPAALRRVSVPRLEALADVVDRYGRPWTEALTPLGATRGAGA